MKSRWARFLPVLLTALWLPVQTLTAFVMPLTLLGVPVPAQAAQAVEGITSVVDAAMPCHGHAADAATELDSHTQPANSPEDDCQRCDACHLACAGYLPVAQASPSLAGGEHVLFSAAMRALSSRFPEPLDHPPRLTA
jgi:hypothetical protein